MKKIISAAAALAVLLVLSFYFYNKEPQKVVPPEQTTKISYVNASSDLIKITSPLPDSVVGSTFSVTGEARGTWFFESSFPVLLLDNKRTVLFQGPAQAQGDWMTTEFVPFKIDIKLTKEYTGMATLVLKKDNPSGIPEKDASISFSVVVAPK